MTTESPGIGPPKLADQLEALAPLAEPVRRALFLYVAGSAEPVSRDEAAAALGISRALAAFHLDHLLEAGLIEHEFRRREAGGRPGRGRPIKLYRRSALDLQLSVPPRQYELAAMLFGDALSAMERPPALDEAARARGRSVGSRVRVRAGSRPNRRRLIGATEDVLAEEGFSPRRCGDKRICLANCPFDALAKAHRDLVCPTNLAMIDGLIQAARIDGLTAHLDHAPGRCCVLLEGPAIEE